MDGSLTARSGFERQSSAFLMRNNIMQMLVPSTGPSVFRKFPFYLFDVFTFPKLGAGAFTVAAASIWNSLSVDLNSLD